MRDLFLFLVAVVLITTNVLTQSDEGKPLEQCRRKNNSTYTHHVPHETDCHKFYKCLGGRGFLKECPRTPKGPLVFNPQEQVCDWEDNVPNVICDDRPTWPTPPPTWPTPPPTWPTPTPTWPTRPPTWPTYPPTWPTYPPTWPTPPPTWPTRPPTWPTPSTTTTTTLKPQPPPAYGCPSIGKTKLPHETDCHYYYMCVNGIKERCRCYDKHKFNNILRACDQEVNVQWCITTRPVQPGDYSPVLGMCPPQSPYP